MLTRLLRTQHRAGQGWSVENPATSLLWQTTHFRQLGALRMVKMVVVINAVTAQKYRKTIGLPTNMAWFEQLPQRCPGQPTHPAHPPQVGNLGTARATWVWRTPLAATRPTELCQAMANCYCKVATAPPGATHPIQWVGNNRLEPLLPPACKVRRAREAEAAIGGLGDPAISLSKLPDLDRYGDILNLVLAKVLDEDPNAESTLLSVPQEESGGGGRRAQSSVQDNTFANSWVPLGQQTWMMCILHQQNCLEHWSGFQRTPTHPSQCGCRDLPH